MHKRNVFYYNLLRTSIEFYVHLHIMGDNLILIINVKNKLSLCTRLD